MRPSILSLALAFAGAVASAAACHSQSAAAKGSEASTQSGTVGKTSVGTDPGHAGRGTPLAPRPGNELAAFAEGCFWGSENTFRHVPGVVATAVGYTGGSKDQPSYEDVCTHTTGHAETVVVEYDPKLVTFAKLVGVFFRSHDPTTRDRQGPDVGNQYRSAIFTFSAEQSDQARAAAEEASKRLGKAVTTQIAPIGKFWKAEEYHQQYDEKTGRESCPLPSVLGT